MKTRLLIIISVIVIVIVIALFVRVKPFNDSPMNHIEELKQIPEVAMFYQNYEKYGIDVFPDGAYSYQVGFQAKNEKEQWIMLKINYRFGIQSDVFVHCTPEGIQSQYTIRENVLDYLKNTDCFN
jgi:uncharacterized protein YxeA